MKTRSGKAVLAGKAAALVLLLARAPLGSDHLPKWTTVGDVLQEVGRTAPGLFNRKALDALVRHLRRTLEQHGIASSFLQRHPTRGLRLTVPPARVRRSRTGRTHWG